ncbi:MAG: hypothetical protein EHM93_02590 [Bacteroidales bacterium]|nr:MAG: hypothetical protein EHM93_02590 [Bacteroidales bacterium]
MKFLAIEVENKGVKSGLFKPHLKNESIKVLELYEKGIVREIYFDQFHCAILILECNSTKEAQEALNQLPLVSNGLIDFRISELNPYTGFSRLLE